MKFRLLNSYFIVGNSKSWPRVLNRMAPDGQSFTLYRWYCDTLPTSKDRHGLYRIFSVPVDFEPNKFITEAETFGGIYGTHRPSPAVHALDWKRPTKRQTIN